MTTRILVEDWLDWIEASEALCHPTEGAFAEALWRLCSSAHGLPVADATQLYRACGYIPFCGYPLARSGKFDSMTREQVEQAFTTNPIIKRYSEAER